MMPMGGWSRRLLNALIAVSALVAIAAVAALAFTLAMFAPSISIGEPLVSASQSSSSVSISLPFNASNPGIFAITVPSVRITIETSGAEPVSFLSEPITIPAGSPSRGYSLAINVNLSALPADELQRLASSSDTIRLAASAGVGVIPLAAFGASVSASAEWSPVVANLTFLAPSVQLVNLTHARVTLPFTFINPSALEVPAVIEGNLTSTYGARARFSDSMTIRSNSPNSGSVFADVPLPANMTDYLTSNQTIRLAASAAVTVFGAARLPFNTTCDVAWGAPMSNLTFGDPEAGPINSTHSIVAVPFSFANANDFMTVEGTFTADLILPNGSVAGTSHQAAFRAPPGDMFSSNVAFEVPNIAASPSYTMVVSFATPYGSFQTEVAVGG